MRWQHEDFVICRDLSVGVPSISLSLLLMKLLVLLVYCDLLDLLTVVQGEFSLGREVVVI